LGDFTRRILVLFGQRFSALNDAGNAVDTFLTPIRSAHVNKNRIQTAISKIALHTAGIGMLMAGMSITVICGAAKQITESTTYQAFNPATMAFDLTKPIQYQLPDPAKFGPGPYPVFIWTPGTFEPYNDPLSILFISQMASRGFLAATVSYDYSADSNGGVRDCGTYAERAQGIFDASRSTSAAAVLCGLSNADCGKGIVTSGVSQGGFLTVLARNYEPNVRATYALSMSDYNKEKGVSLASCVDKQYTAIPANRLTIVNGASDTSFVGQQPIENVSGYTCPNGATQCWSPDNSGAGWYIVQDSQVRDGLADHCYFLMNGCLRFEQGDPGWMPPSSFNWSLGTNLDWLATFGTQRVFSPTGQ
jgi:hypothetical protein